MKTKTTVDLAECLCPWCDSNIDTTGDGAFTDPAWCLECDWEGECCDLLPAEDPPVQVQTRAAGKLEYFDTVKEAMEHAAETPAVWKVSFAARTGERIRLVRVEDRFIYEDLMDEVEKALEDPDAG